MSTTTRKVVDEDVQFAQVLQKARRAPQPIVRGDETVAYVVDLKDYQLLEDARQRASFLGRLAELLKLSTEIGGPGIHIPKRKNRPAVRLG